MSESKKAVSNPFLNRYSPNCRFVFGAFKTQTPVIIRKDDFGESITDKEAYRLSLASARGSIAASGSLMKGVYMYDDGKYDEAKDFSYIMRKDLSIVQIDEYIKQKESELKDADSKLKKQIENELIELKTTKEQMEKEKEKEDNSTSE